MRPPPPQDHPSPTAPSLADIDALARAAFAAMPEGFRAQCPGLAVLVEDFPSDDLLVELGVEDPYELTGVYEGATIAGDGATPAPDRVVLFRRPILDEWIDRGNVTLAELVGHVLVHEIAHHFGMTDDDIAAIDDWTA